MSSHALTSMFLSNASDASNSTEIAITNATTASKFPSSTTLASTLATNVKLLVTKPTTVTTTTPSPLSTTTVAPDDSHFIFGFCTVLFFVAIALIMKIVYSNRKKYRNLTPSIPSWRLSASRSSGNMPPGFSLTRDSFAPRTARGEAFGSAHYSVVPPSTTARLSQQHDAFVGNSNTHEWERGFFEDDTSNDNMDSRLELRR